MLQAMVRRECCCPSTQSLRLSTECSNRQCAECHADTADHELEKTVEMAFLCKKCKRAFRKDMTRFEEADEYCPHCDNKFVSHHLSLGRAANGC